MIDPGTNQDGETVEAYCRRRWGGSGWTRSMISSGKKDGATFSDWKIWPHTLKAHQLVHYFATKVPAANGDSDDGSTSFFSTDKVNQFLFQAEYERGENISKIDTLVNIAKELLETNNNNNNNNQEIESILRDLRNYLSQNLGARDVQEEINLGRQRYRISGVPYFIVGLAAESTESHGSEEYSSRRRPYGLSGAQSPQTFVEIFEELDE